MNKWNDKKDFIGISAWNPTRNSVLSSILSSIEDNSRCWPSWRSIRDSKLFIYGSIRTPIFHILNPVLHHVARRGLGLNE